LPRSGVNMPVTITASQLEILDMDIKARRIAVTMETEKNEEQVELAVKSGDRIHRIAAAFYYQNRREPSPCLMNLLADNDPIVVEAARIALVIIANDKRYRRPGAYHQAHIIDFGPWMFGPGKQKSDGQVDMDGLTVRREAIDLWQSHFDKVEANNRKVEVEQKAKMEREKAKETDPRKVLGVE
jgi:hypothetical protein